MKYFSLTVCMWNLQSVLKGTKIVLPLAQKSGSERFLLLFLLALSECACTLEGQRKHCSVPLMSHKLNENNNIVWVWQSVVFHLCLQRE